MNIWEISQPDSRNQANALRQYDSDRQDQITSSNEGITMAALAQQMMAMQGEMEGMKKMVAGLENVAARISEMEKEVAGMKKVVARIPEMKKEVARIPEMEKMVDGLVNKKAPAITLRQYGSDRQDLDPSSREQRQNKMLADISERMDTIVDYLREGRITLYEVKGAKKHFRELIIAFENVTDSIHGLKEEVVSVPDFQDRVCKLLAEKGVEAVEASYESSRTQTNDLQEQVSQLQAKVDHQDTTILDQQSIMKVSKSFIASITSGKDNNNEKNSQPDSRNHANTLRQYGSDRRDLDPASSEQRQSQMLAELSRRMDIIIDDIRQARITLGEVKGAKKHFGELSEVFHSVKASIPGLKEEVVSVPEFQDRVSKLLVEKGVEALKASSESQTQADTDHLLRIQPLTASVQSIFKSMVDVTPPSTAKKLKKRSTKSDKTCWFRYNTTQGMPLFFLLLLEKTV
eukprot:CAMPEP_0113645414 /NCGR_PEP_ID=MMETSP0017_2-20120614/23935_1 /TAXON_ID=2856 /ORGANISM="Cylindrotheca closterium" /LENGTH=459 /DNA_ID=CAMNT_0000557143 /DNA_START=167 /DNA_END=1544 /DNA_ORIENTATION=+ /assembly_acc=CAM_ASM_000147